MKRLLARAIDFVGWWPVPPGLNSAAAEGIAAYDSCDMSGVCFSA